MSDTLILDSSKALQDLFYQYTHLPIDGKKIVCPYWMNNLEKGIYGPIGGKGTPEQIADEVIKEAKSENVDLKKMDKESIVLFMKAKKIGIDCSGFVYWMLNSLDLEKKGNGIADDIPGSKGNVVQARANVQMLTDEKVSFPVEKLKDIKVGDMVRLRRGKHVAIILSIKREEGQVREIEYAHSSGGYTKISGVHSAKITIISPNADLKSQNWSELTLEEKSYRESYYPQAGDGVKRLRIWK